MQYVHNSDGLPGADNSNIFIFDYYFLKNEVKII